MLFYSWFAPLLAFCTCWLVLVVLMQRAGYIPMDYPNRRSLHATPKPRIGGIGIIGGLFFAAILIQAPVLWPFVLGAGVLAGISLLDDYKSLSVHWRLLAHIGVAAGVLMFSHVEGLNLLVATLAIVWMTNLYNFMDGADGLAGGMAVVGFSALALASWWIGASELALFCVSISAAALAFLRFNFPPAKLFMGDVGSIPLGFLAAAIGVYGISRGYWPMLFPVIVFSPFIMDASVTLIKRFARGEKIWRAHHEHYYQRLVRMGWSHRKMTSAAYALMLLCAVVGLIDILKPELAVFLIPLWMGSYLLIFITLDWRWSHLKHEI